MKDYRKMVSIASVVLGLSIIASVLVAQSEGHTNSSIQKSSDEGTHYPIVDYSAVELIDGKEKKARQVKSERFNKRHLVPRQEPSPHLEMLPVIDHTLSRLPALPALMSDAVLLGEVIDAHAYLSNDKTGVYSEFTLRVKEILKQNSDGSLYPTSIIIGTREGGDVRYPSGRIQRFSIHNQGMPQLGRNYLLFLKRNGQELGFDILTGYELRQGQVFPLDGSDRAKLPFSAYKGADETAFLNAVRDAVSQASQSAKRRENQ
jgi:hypothetical protein